MEVSETLRKAWAAVEDAGLPDKIHEVAFREAVRLLVPTLVVTAPDAATPWVGKPGGAAGGTGGSSGEGSIADTGITVSEDEIYDRIATHTGVDRHRLDQVVHLDGNQLNVSIPGIRLGRNTAERARAVAQILTISRGFGLEESETSLEVIRAECDRLHVYDQNNFAAHIKALNGYVIIGTGTNRRVRARGAAIEEFPALVDTLLGAQ